MNQNRVSWYFKYRLMMTTHACSFPIALVKLLGQGDGVFKVDSVIPLSWNCIWLVRRTNRRNKAVNRLPHAQAEGDGFDPKTIYLLNTCNPYHWKFFCIETRRKAIKVEVTNSKIHTSSQICDVPCNTDYDSDAQVKSSLNKLFIKQSRCLFCITQKSGCWVITKWSVFLLC